MLAAVILSLTLVPKWSMTFLIVFGMLVLAVVAILRKTSRKQESSTFEYDVFLNVRDPIDELGDLLCDSFWKCGINVCRDQNKLSLRENISPEVKVVIKRSRFSIAIISPSYASSKRYLGELEQMWDCRESQGQEIIPIFLGVSPTEVENQTGIFEQAFNLHKNEIDSKTIERWKEVLRQIGRLKGYGSYEWRAEEISKKVVLRVLHVLSNHRVETDHLVGIDHVKRVMDMLDITYSEGQVDKVSGKEVRIVVICGAHGAPDVKKTTLALAKCVFSKIRKGYDACSFLRGISSKGVSFSKENLIADLQKLKHAPLNEGIASSKVLIVLDDVHKDEHIRKLVGEFIEFGPGSRIIATTNSENVLQAFKVGAVDHRKVEIYKVEDASHYVSMPGQRRDMNE